MFFDHFFEKEGNQLEHSFIAIELDEVSNSGDRVSDRVKNQADIMANGKGVGVVLGGIRMFDHQKTMRCGGLCVIPSKRGTDLAKRLMAEHKKEAEAMQCDRLFLEVINGNDRAVKLYERLGYQICGNLWYYHLDQPEVLTSLREQMMQPKSFGEGIEIKPISFETLKAYRESLPNVYVNWQNEMETIEKRAGSQYGAYAKGHLVGAVAHFKSSIQFIAIDEAFRGKGIAQRMVGHILQMEPDLTGLRFSFPDHAGMESLMKRLGSSKDALSQYEMVMSLK